MYVALTRARHQAIVWWAGTRDCRDSPLGRLVFSRGEDGSIAHAGGHVPRDDVAVERFAAIAERAPGCISVARSGVGRPAHWSPRLPPPSELAAAVFDRELDRHWRRTSYSDLTAGAHEATVASEPEEGVVSDEPAEPVAIAAAVSPSAADDALAAPSLLAGMPGGVRVGTFVHDVFEATDFAAADLEAELAAQVAVARSRRSVEIGDASAVVAGLQAAIETPLGPLAGGIALRDVGRADRLDELVFELPLAGGDAARGEVTTAAVAAVLRRHLAAGDPLMGYAERLGDPALRHAVRGYLTGSIDLVLRLDGARFAVVDYKSNWLAPAGELLTIGHHGPGALAAEMQRMHYVLQGLLYTVALHRYLRWRVPGYDPERNLAGILYLFVRGMAGAATPVVDGATCGVFAWRPPGALVGELSDVLDRGVGA
jgi:exodeoxyribonuclease V beta subunit